jgi:hypothetical protein
VKFGPKGDLAFEEANLKLKREVFREAPGPASVSSVTNTGSYSMGGKWVAQLIVPAMRPEPERSKRSGATAFETTESSPRDLKRVFLGRFDSEDDALSVVKVAKQEWATTGNFTPRRMLPSPRPGSYISPSMQIASGGGQAYGYSHMTGRATTQAASQYLPGNGSGSGGGQQMKPMYYGSGSSAAPIGMGMGAPGGGSRPQSGLPPPSPQQSGQHQYPSFLPTRGAMSQPPVQQPPSYLSAPRSNLPPYRPGELPSSQQQPQGIPPYANQHFQRSSTGPTDPISYPTPPDGQVPYQAQLLTHFLPYISSPR